MPAPAAEAATAPVEPASLPLAEAIISEPPAAILDQAPAGAPPVETSSDVIVTSATPPTELAPAEVVQQTAAEPSGAPTPTGEPAPMVPPAVVNGAAKPEAAIGVAPAS